MVLLISYDLNGYERPDAYAKVKEIIEENSGASIKPLYSQWFVETTLSPDDWIELLKPAFDTGDKCFVEQVRQPYQGWLSENHWDWLRQRV